MTILKVAPDIAGGTIITRPANPDAVVKLDFENEPAATRVVLPGRILIDDILGWSLILRDDWEALPEADRERLHRELDGHSLLAELVERNLLTEFQAKRIETGKVRGLFFGNYRVLDRIGAGGMGVVYKAEHILLRRLSALKVLPNPFDEDVHVLSRFLAEIRSIAQLQHPPTRRAAQTSSNPACTISSWNLCRAKISTSRSGSAAPCACTRHATWSARSPAPSPRLTNTG
jgi:hypothetical protein